MTYRVILDRELCSGFGACLAAAPGLFRLEADGRAVALASTTSEAAALEAAAACPMAAITIVEERAA
jgi:ferredoxin